LGDASVVVVAFTDDDDDGDNDDDDEEDTAAAAVVVVEAFVDGPSPSDEHAASTPNSTATATTSRAGRAIGSSACTA
jgi:hypothetical protein